MLKEPITSTNRLYYNLQFLTPKQDNMEAMAIQHLILVELIKLLHLVDESTVLLPYKTYFAQKGGVLSEPEKVGQSYTVVSTCFQRFGSQKVNETMYVSILLGYNPPPEDFYPTSFCKEMENLSHKIYTCSIQVPFISSISWLFQLHKHTNLPFLSEFLEGLQYHLLPNGPTIALGFK